METRIVKATQELIDSMKGKLRKKDDDEVRAVAGMCADDSLQLGFDLSVKCWVLETEGRGIACFGIVPRSTIGDIAYPWMLATDELLKVKKDVVKYSKEKVKEMLDEYPVLVNYADIRNTVSMRWLKWCGFIFEEPERYGVEDRLFKRFYMLRRTHV